MADHNSSLLSQILVPVAIAILAGGTSPWWYKAISKKRGSKSGASEADNTKEPLAKAPESAFKSPAADVAASRDFVIGRWRAAQRDDSGGIALENEFDYFSNGKFEGWGIQVDGNQNRRCNYSGTWDFEKLSEQSYRLTWHYDSGHPAWSQRYKIVDVNHVLNLDLNHVVERVE